jgi:hypothetical protein
MTSLHLNEDRHHFGDNPRAGGLVTYRKRLRRTTPLGRRARRPEKSGMRKNLLDIY